MAGPLSEHIRPSRPPSRRRRRGAVIEAAVAAVILVTVALVSGRGGVSSASLPSSAIASWDSRALPVIAQLVDDVAAIEGDTAPNQGFSLVRLRQDGTGLQRHLAAAQALRSPPDPAQAVLWAVALQQLGDGRAMIDAAVAEPTATAIARVRQQLALAGDGLLQLSQNIQSAG
jgi:hypothetical protein